MANSYRYITEELKAGLLNPDYDPFRDFGRFSSPCNSGKSTAASGEIQAALGINKKDSLVAGFRRAAIDQQIESELFTDVTRVSAFTDKVPITTAHAIGGILCNDKRYSGEKYDHLRDLVANPPKLVIVDEIHCLSEGDFAFSLNAFWNWCKELYANPDTAIISLDATEKFLVDYLLKQESIKSVNVLAEEMKPTNIPKKIIIYPRNNITTLIPTIRDSFNAENKAFILGNTTETNYKMKCETPHSAFICSDNSKKKIKIADKEIRAKDIMSDMDRECLASIKKNKCLPKDIWSIYSTIILREGTEYKDNNMKVFATDLVDEIGIIQGLNRVRTQLDTVYITGSSQGKHTWIESSNRLLEEYEYGLFQDEEYRKEYLEEYERLEEQYELKEIEDKERLPPLVYRENNEYKLNRLALITARYKVDMMERLKHSPEEYYRYILRDYPQNIIEFKDNLNTDNYRNKKQNESIENIATDETKNKLKKWIDEEINFTDDKETARKLMNDLGARTKNKKLKALSAYTKGKEKETLCTIGLYMDKWKTKGKTYYCLRQIGE